MRDRHARHLRQTVGLQAAADDQRARPIGLRRRRDADGRGLLPDRYDFGGKREIAAGGAEIVRKGRADALVIDDRRRGDEKRRETGDIGFAARQFARVDALNLDVIFAGSL